MKRLLISAIAVLAIIQFMAEPGQAITCGQIDVALAPCVPYLILGGSPSPACCNGVKSVKGMAQTTADKRAACNCLKEAANSYPNLKDDAVQALLAKCGVQMDIPLSRSINCDVIN